MKNHNLFYGLFILLINFSSVYAQSQTISTRYDLNFQQINSCTKPWSSWGENCRFILDSTTLKAGKPALKLSYTGSGNERKMCFSLFKTILLPVNDRQKKADISIISKADITGDFWIKVSSIDKNEKEIAFKTVKINNSEWGKRDVSIIISGAKAIRINIRYNGNNELKQNIWIDRVGIKIDEKDITKQSYFSNKKEDSIKVFKSLSQEHIIPLIMDNDSTLLTGITDFNNKKIIGIGESAHGSSTMKLANYQFLKNLILKANCKLVLLEYPTDMTLLWELYVQGKISTDYQNQIEADAKCLFNDYGQLLEFINWIRIYNEGSSTKVHIFGMDNPTASNLYFFEYNLALLGKDQGRLYLKMISEKKYEELIDYAKTDPVLKEKLGVQGLEFYLNFLKNEMISIKSEAEFRENRDLNMLKRTQRMMEIYLKPQEKLAIYAHSGHLEYSEPYDDYSEKNATLGFHLRKIFANQYFSISFQIGYGKYTQDECFTKGKVFVDSLKNPPPYSFEYAGLRTGLDYFYFQSKYLGDGILSYADIARASREENLFKFSSLKKRFNAYVFIRESKEIKKIEEFPWLYTIDRFYEKRLTMKSILKELDFL